MQPESVVPQVRSIARQGAESHNPLNWGWVEASGWTERMLAALGNGVKGGRWMPSSQNEDFHHARSLDSSESIPMRKPPTGEPCAGEPHARFGGRGGVKSFPTSIAGIISM